MKTNFELTQIVRKEFHEILQILNMEKDVFYILVSGKFLNFCLFSAELRMYLLLCSQELDRSV